MPRASRKPRTSSSSFENKLRTFASEEKADGVIVFALKEGVDGAMTIEGIKAVSFSSSAEDLLQRGLIPVSNHARFTSEKQRLIDTAMPQVDKIVDNISNRVLSGIWDMLDQRRGKR